MGHLQREQTASTEALALLDAAAGTHDFDGERDALVEIQRDIAAGLDPATVRSLRNAGLSAADVERTRLAVIGNAVSGFSRAGLARAVSDIQSTNAALAGKLGGLASDLDAVIAEIASLAVPERLPVANAGGPYATSERSAVDLDGSGSNDPDGTVASYAWDLDGDAEFDDATGPTPSYTATTAGEALLGLKVTDDDGRTNVAYARVTVAEMNRPPTITAFEPAAGVHELVVGDELAFSTSTSDPDGDAVTTSWLIDGAKAATGDAFTLRSSPAAPGIHTVVARASDSRPDGGEASHVWLVSVVRPDADVDGWRANVDCDDNDAAVNPDADEVANNGKDDDCDPATDDGAPVVSVRDVSVLEGDGGQHSATFELELSTPASGAVSLDVRTSDVTATHGEDYVGVTGTITFAPGQVRETVEVAVLGDTVDEAVETFQLRITNVTAATLANDRAVATIRDDDAPPVPPVPEQPALSIADVSGPEGDGEGQARVQVSLSAPSDSEVSVDYRTVDATAMAGMDYRTAVGTLSFAAGQTSKSITAVLVGDRTDELDETFQLRLSNASGASLTKDRAVVTILDDDDPSLPPDPDLPTLSVADIAVSEGDSQGVARLVLTLSAASDREVSVDHRTIDVSATAGLDYRIAAGTLRFAPGETTKSLTVVLLGDRVDEPDETFQVRLGNPSGATLTADSAVVTINDDDAPTPPAPPPAALLDRAAFLRLPGAKSATGPLPRIGPIPSPHTVGDVTFSRGPRATGLQLGTLSANGGDWSSVLPGHELAIDAFEDLNIALAKPVKALGFDFVEPISGFCGEVCVDSLFQVTLKLGAAVVRTFSYDAPNDTPWFIGITSDAPFDRVELRELEGGEIEDEYFGQFYTAEEPRPGPGTPGRPQLTEGSATPNRGEFSLGWQPSTGGADPIRYALQQDDVRNNGYRTVDGAGDLEGADFAFGAATRAPEGTHTYRVRALVTAAAQAPCKYRLDFDQPGVLPSSQGWGFVSIDHSGAREDDVFSVSDGALHQNTTTIPTSGAGHIIYQRSDFDPTLPFRISLRARVLAQTGQTHNPYGFFAGLETGLEEFSVGVGVAEVKDSHARIVARLDATSYRIYSLESFPSSGYRLFIDGSLVATGAPLSIMRRPRLSFGDGTAGAGAKVDIDWFCFSQDPPELGSAFSPESEPVKVDRTAPGAPTASIAAADYDPPGDANDWHKDTAVVSFVAGPDPDLPDGSRGSGIDPATLSADMTFTTSGTHTAAATVADRAGNVSRPVERTVRVDADPPFVEIRGCPAVVHAGDTVNVEVLASDVQSGLRDDPSGPRVLDTADAGGHDLEVLARDNVGHQARATCRYRVNTTPVTPGPPVADETANRDGTFNLAWDPAGDVDGDPVTYTLLRRAADDGYTAAKRGIAGSTHAFQAGSPEREGTFTYRVIASDGERSSAPSGDSTPVKVDKTAPNAPTASLPAPFWVDPLDPANAWYRDRVTLAFAAAGDPSLADDSPGSGVDPSTLGPDQTFSTSGEHQASDTVLDFVGNESLATTRTVKVDSDPPTITISCPQIVQRGQAASAIISAADRQSGLAADTSGTVALDTATAGDKTFTTSARDRVDHTTTASCGYRVEGGASCEFTGFFPPVENPDSGRPNKVQAGRTIPVKFKLCADLGRDILAPGAPYSQQINCRTNQPLGPTTSTAPPGTQGLHHHPGSRKYTYLWKTDKRWKNQCRILNVTLRDGSDHIAYFDFTKHGDHDDHDDDGCDHDDKFSERIALGYFGNGDHRSPASSGCDHDGDRRHDNDDDHRPDDTRFRASSHTPRR